LGDFFPNHLVTLMVCEANGKIEIAKKNQNEPTKQRFGQMQNIEFNRVKNWGQCYKTFLRALLILKVFVTVTFALV
jgi:hypothetical protein